MILCFQGGLGQGKTFCASLFAIMLKDLNRKLTLYANYDLVLAKKFTKLDELLDIKNSIIVYDELHLDIDSRKWFKNEAIINFLLQLRKYNNFLLYTTQHIRQVDIRLRNITNYIFEIVKTPNYFFIFAFDGLSLQLLRNFKISRRAIEKLGLYKIYNTFEIVKPVEIPEDEKTKK